LGITKATLAEDSFFSCELFSQTTHVLADAAIKGKVDDLISLKKMYYWKKLSLLVLVSVQYRHIPFLQKEQEKQRKRELQERLSVGTDGIQEKC
jgi:DNA-directed RNA polymerase subunit beta'